MTLQEIIKDKKIQDEISQMDVGNDVRSYSIKLGKINRAKDELLHLFNLYRMQLKEQCFFVLSCGTNSKDFTKKSEEFECFTGDVMDVAKDVTKEISEEWHSRERFNPSMLETCNAFVEDMAFNMGIAQLPQMVFNSNMSLDVSTKEKFNQVMLEVILNQLGGEFFGYYWIDKVARACFNANHVSKYIPIVLECDKAFCDAFKRDLCSITPHVFVVESNEEVKNKDLEKTLKTIRKSLA